MHRLTDGEVDASLGAIGRRAYLYEETTDRHFGLTRHDFRGPFMMLALETLVAVGNTWVKHWMPFLSNG